MRTRNDDVGEYPWNWDRIAHRVKRFWGWRCERCGHPNAPAVGRTLTVHHLDGDKSNCRPWNLAALCQVCHLQIQAKVAWYQYYPFEHTPWMQWHWNRYVRKCQQLGVHP